MRNTREDFPILKRQVDGEPIIYFDSAATSLTPQPVIDAVTGFYTHHTANVHRAMHLLAEEATELFEGARQSLARFFNAEQDEVVFVRGTTEAINLVHRCYPGLKRTVTTAMEHHSNFLPWAFGDGAHVVPVDPMGRLDMDNLAAALKNGADLVAVSHVSNALGAIAPIEEVIRLAHDAGALVLVDAAQSAPHMPIDVKKLDVDFLACSAHKMLGPGGVGVLYAKKHLLERMTPWHVGGNVVDQVHIDDYTLQDPPHRFEAGTPAIEAVIGWGAAIEYLTDLGMDQVQAHDRQLVAYALDKLGQIDFVKLTGPTDPASRCASVSFNVESLEAHGVARMLSNRSNIFVRSGFHCAQPLHETLGLLPTVRASFYIYNQPQEIDALAQALHGIVAYL